MADIKVILIGGTSHVGKSTLGRKLAEELGWDFLSTDQLARHPGRPWRAGDLQLPDDVIAHYADLTVPELTDAVLQHYRRNVWPIVQATVNARLQNPFDSAMVIEGSAVLPQQASAAQHSRIDAVWLTASDHVIEERIKRNSAYTEMTSARRALVDAFLQRTLEFAGVLEASLAKTNQRQLDATADDAFDTLLSLAGPNR
ncbi:MAG: AAA family ATPase [Pseudomonadota bacterium]